MIKFHEKIALLLILSLEKLEVLKAMKRETRGADAFSCGELARARPLAASFMAARQLSYRLLYQLQEV